MMNKVRIRTPRHLSAAHRNGFLCLAASATLALVACHSYHVDATVENQTGMSIQLLEVDYPTASFGADALAPGAVLHYRFQLRGNGPLKVQYTGSDGRQVNVGGPSLEETQEGALRITLLTAGKVEFHPDLKPAR